MAIRLKISLQALRQLRLAVLAIGALLFSPLAQGEAPPVAPRHLDQLRILQPEHPRVFFFRAAESAARHPATPYEEWDAEFSRLMGIMGKCLDEEVPGTEVRNPDFFTRFKQRHPNQVVLLHFNGNARDPRYRTRRYFSGHWIYREATLVLSDLKAEPGETTLRVANARDFKVNTGRYGTSSDDLGLFGITPGGSHDWQHCEQVQLVAVDYESDTIRIRRGCYGTQPLSFRAGQTRVAAHAVEGPWGRQNNLLWFYNFSTHCPKDQEGRTCADRLVEDLAEWFGPEGLLRAFDGVEFDVMHHQTHGDTDGDGRLDQGIKDGLNRYGLGMVDFARQLRTRMGDEFIIQGDGALGPGGERSQRAWGLLNGIESEGWPNLREWDMDDWSGGLNRHDYWRAQARPPVFNYINHKWVEPVPGQPGQTRHPHLPWARHRLAFAAGVFTDSMICYSTPPPRNGRGQLGVWDEFIAGTAHQLGWLGQAQGDAVHLAAQSPDLLQGLGQPAATRQLAHRIQGDVRTEPSPEGLWIRSPTNQDQQLTFSLPSVPTQGRDLVVIATLNGQPRQGFPSSVARLARIGVVGAAYPLITADLPATGILLRRQGEVPFDAATGAAVRYLPRQEIGGQILPAYMTHPPYQDNKGAVFWWRDLLLPENPDLRFSIGMGEKSPTRSDGVWFQVWVAPCAGGKPGAFTKLFEQATKDHAWQPKRVALSRWAGQQVRLKFVADCGPHDNATTDHAYWGNVQVTQAGVTDTAVTSPKSYMTWVGPKPFTATFYFREIQSPTVDLRFDIEGPEPVQIRQLTVHAHPDTIYRLFERGLVLANPGLTPYTFDLQTISPNRNYRRLAATAGQDPLVNNGLPTQKTVTLNERDALFLRRD